MYSRAPTNRRRMKHFTDRDDPGAALIAFSRSFKKIRRTKTTKARRRLHLSARWKRAQSLPNLCDLLDVVSKYYQCREPPPPPPARFEAISARVLHGYSKCGGQRRNRNRSNSLFTSALQLPSSRIVLQDGGFFTKQYLSAHLEVDDRQELALKVNGGPRLHPIDALSGYGFAFSGSVENENRSSQQLNVNCANKPSPTPHKVSVREVYNKDKVCCTDSDHC
ncbi:unnamed protein product [Anisakis simplex]|uniref:LAM_G_DOMAIN domain-containing protein n=1 Tax=Anisakis simplex TaxID=6269 RepID=A0A0M3K8Z3_ANISI|nr:unnamed protein product [Anisakis simplex]